MRLPVPTPPSDTSTDEVLVMCGTCGNRHAPLAVRLDRARELAQAVPASAADDDGRDDPRVWIAVLIVYAAGVLLLIAWLIARAIVGA